MESIQVERIGDVVVVSLDRPPHNALTLPVYQDLAEVFRDIGHGGAHCAILTGRGSSFCIGRDFEERLSAPSKEDPVRAQAVRTAFRAVRTCAIPVIGAINGAARGAGLLLASVCDVRIVSSQATFTLNQIDLGRCGGAAHLTRFLSPGQLRRWYFTGAELDAAQVERMGFADEVVAPDQLMPAAVALAQQIAAKNPLGLRMAKEALNRVEFLPLDEGYELEQRYSSQLLGTHDAREAMQAYAENRKPIFTGR